MKETNNNNKISQKFKRMGYKIKCVFRSKKVVSSRNIDIEGIKSIENVANKDQNNDKLIEKKIEEIEVNFIEPKEFKIHGIEAELPCSVDALYDILFTEDEFNKSQREKDKLTDVIKEKWSEGSYKVGSVFKIEYTMPRMGLVPSNRAYVEITVKQVCKGKGYEVLQVTNNPGVPLGKNFEIQIQYILKPTGPTSCKVKVTADVVFKHSTIFKKFIVDASCKEIKNLFNDRWFPALTEYVKANCQQEEVKVEKTLATAKPSSSSNRKSIYLGKNFNNIQSSKAVASEEVTLLNVKLYRQFIDSPAISSPWFWCVVFLMMLYCQTTAILGNNSNIQNIGLNRSVITV